MRSNLWLNLSRLGIGLVTGVNLQCAFAFVIQPAAFASSFELNGEPGAASVRGIGILFIMWNIPYLAALVHPVRRFVSLWEAIIMQAVGLLGETWILFSLSSSHPILRTSISRFILFDAVGLGLLGLSMLFARKARKNHPVRRIMPV